MVPGGLKTQGQISKRNQVDIVCRTERFEGGSLPIAGSKQASVRPGQIGIVITGMSDKFPPTLRHGAEQRGHCCRVQRSGREHPESPIRSCETFTRDDRRNDARAPQQATSARRIHGAPGCRRKLHAGSNGLRIARIPAPLAARRTGAILRETCGCACGCRCASASLRAFAGWRSGLPLQPRSRPAGCPPPAVDAESGPVLVEVVPNAEW